MTARIAAPDKIAPRGGIILRGILEWENNAHC